MDKNYIFLKEIHQRFQICTQNLATSNFEVLDLVTFTLTLKFIKSVSFLKHKKKSQELNFLFSHNINFHTGSQTDFLKIEHVLAITTFNLGYEYILNCLNCI